MKKKGIIVGVLAFIFLSGGITYAVVQHNNEVQAKAIAQKKQEEQENLKDVEAAVDVAYKSRKQTDIDLATTAISKLSENQKSDKTRLTKKMTKLNEFLKQVTDLNAAIDKATKSKADTDIEAVQVLLNNMTNSYLNDDKEAAQEKLDALKTQIEEEKAQEIATAEAQRQAEEAAAAQEAAEAAKNAISSQAGSNQVSSSDSGNSSNGSAGGCSLSGNSSSSNSGGGQSQSSGSNSSFGSSFTPSTPSGPSQGDGGSGGNASGIEDSPGGWDNQNNAGWEGELGDW